MTESNPLLGNNSRPSVIDPSVKSVDIFGWPIVRSTKVASVLDLVSALILLGLRIWYTMSITLIQGYLIAVSAIHILSAIFGIYSVWKASYKIMRLQFVVFCFSFVFEISAWIVLLAEVAVVSWPKSLCNDPRSGCAVQSEVIYALGIALASLSILFLIFDLLLLKLYSDYLNYLKDMKEKRLSFTRRSSSEKCNRHSNNS